MIPEMSTDASVAGLKSGNADSDCSTDCDNVIRLVDDFVSWDQSMSSDQNQQRRTLRSVPKRNYSETTPKKARPTEVLIDSDEENELVIDCDSSPEETTTVSDCVADDENAPDDKRRKTLRSKQQSPEKGVSSKCVDGEDDSPEIEEVLEKKPKLNSFRANGFRSCKLKRRFKRPVHQRLLTAAKSIQQSCLKRYVQAKRGNKCPKPRPEGSKCPICGDEFADSHTFTIHIREHNTNNFAHTCKICSKQLSSASSLDRHMYVHSGERPFECGICSLKFTTNGNMHRHMKIHESSPSVGAVKVEKKGLKRMSNGKEKNPDTSPLPIKSEALSDDDDDDDCCEGGGADDADESAPRPSDDQKLSCPACGKYFLTPGTLKTHLLVHSDDPIRCPTCGLTSKNYASYKEHHCSPAAVENGDCTADAKSSKVGFHDLSFVEFSSSKFALIAKQACERQARNPSSAFLSWECAKCAKAFPSDLALDQHEIGHENEASTTCETCKCDFSSVGGFRNHQLRHRAAESAAQSLADGGKNGEGSRKEDFMASLELCDKRQATSRSKSHRSSSKPRQFDGLGYFCQEIPPAADECKDQSESGRDFADITSIISLTSKTPLVPNMRASPVTASPASPPSATELTSIPTPSPVIEGSANPPVETVVPTGNSSDSHSAKDEDEMSVETENEGQFNCRKCSKSFGHPNELKAHMKVHVRSSPLHQCNFCPYQSVDKSTLKRHLRKHNGEHPFKCSICDYVFTTKANGHRHVKNKHKLSDLEAADAVVYNPNMLESKDADSMSSEANSTETVCKYCKQDFKYNRVLRHHLRSLNNSCSRKPYSCSICKQGFSTKNNCIRHVTNHHPECRDKAKEFVVVNEASLAAAQEPTQQVSPPQNLSSNQSEEAASDSESPAAAVAADAATGEPLNLSVATESRDSGSQVTVDRVTAEDFPGSDAEMVSVAESLVSLSEVMPPQDQPLDLTICAIDLSLRNSLSSCAAEVTAPIVVAAAAAPPPPLPPVTNGLEVTASRPAPGELSKQSQPSSCAPDVQASPVNLTSTPRPLDLAKNTAVPLCLMSEISNREDSNSCGISPLPVACLPKVASAATSVAATTTTTTGSSGKSPMPAVLSKPPTRQPVPPTHIENPVAHESPKPGQKIKRFSCEICQKGFTLKSNRERHIKNHHPEHARPPRSRNYIPTLSSATAGVQKPSGSALSDKTRDALRVALIAKSNTNSSSMVSKTALKAGVVVQSLPRTPPQFVCPPSENGRGGGDDDQPSSRSRNEGASDLASVSSVIDTVNCQTFKQYLIEAKELPDNQSGSKAAEPLDNPPDAPGPNVSPSSSETAKKSSYAKCVKSIHCTYCKRKFPWKSSLSRHLLTHTGLKPHKCPKCPLSFTTKSNRDRHLYRQHGDSEELVALGEKPHKCGICTNCYFSTRGKLKKHYFLKHSSSVCPDSLSPEGGARSSIRSADNGNGSGVVLNRGGENPPSDDLAGTKPQVSEDEDDESSTLSDEASDSLDCHVCGRTFKSQASLLSHLKEAHPVTTSDSTTSSPEKAPLMPVVANIKVEPEDNDQAVVAPSQCQHRCQCCSLAFESAQELQTHAKSHQKVALGGRVNVTQAPVGPRENGFSLPKIPGGLPKKTPNSLLYLFAAAQHARSVDSALESRSSDLSKKSAPSTSGPVDTTPDRTDAASAAGSTAVGVDDDNSLILNLLGLKDPEFLDEMLDSAVRSRVKKETVEA